ncbi:hypothetical protein ACIPY5_04810 [Microbacterium sp. NPDC089698]|uniref:hypothetical protein n=1 Tax=Microbacterium sp. NPDC089698 TaxID=3364200 RepID=UPI003803D7E9
MSTTPLDPALVDPGAERVAEYSRRGFADDVLPIRPQDRTWRTTQFLTVWMGPIHNILIKNLAFFAGLFIGFAGYALLTLAARRRD